MATTTFVNGVTLTDAAWFNDADRLIYDIFGNPTNIGDIQSLIGTTAITGTIIDHAGLNLPSGWLFCDGSAVSRTTYADLFAELVTSSAVTLTATSPGKVNWTAHGLVNYMPVRLTASGSLPTEVISDAIYYVSNATTNDFEITDVPGGTAINFSGAGSGVSALCAPWGDGDGSTTFNVPDLRMRGRIMTGKMQWEEEFSSAQVSVANDTITITNNTAKYITGLPVVISLVSGTFLTATGVTSGTTVYLIRDTVNTVKLATSATNAQNGTAVNITAAGSGTMKFAYTYTYAKGLGEIGGEVSHLQYKDELAAHNHGIGETNTTGFTAGGQGRPNANTQIVSSTTGGQSYMNTYHPYAAVRSIIKT